MSCFVTVGSTKFNELVAEVCSVPVLLALKTKGYESICIQIGKSDVPNSFFELCTDKLNFLDKLNAKEKIQLELHLPNEGRLKAHLFRFLPSIEEEIQLSSLVISHAGAGSSLETLSMKKPLITVINDNLMDQHQSELAEKLAQLRYSVCCKPNSLLETVKKFDEKQLEEYEPGQPHRFCDYLNSQFVVYK